MENEFTFVKFLKQKFQEMGIFNRNDNVISSIEKYLDSIDQSSLVFKIGVSNYLYGRQDDFEENLRTISKLESEADTLRREIENMLYKYSLIPQLRGDILRLLEDLDEIIDIIKENLFQFDVEMPNIPRELVVDFLKLSETAISSVDSLIPATRAYFRSPETVKDQLHRVYFFEKEADKLAYSIKRKVFREMTSLKLSEKFHLRYFTLHIEEVSDVAEKVADLLSIMAIKRTL